MKCNGFAPLFWEQVERFDSDIFHQTVHMKVGDLMAEPWQKITGYKGVHQSNSLGEVFGGT